MWSARQRPFYSVGGEPEDGDGDDDDATHASGNNVGVCVPHHGPTTNRHASCGAFLPTRSGGDGDKAIILIYCMIATSQIHWTVVRRLLGTAVVMTATTLL